MTGRMLEPWGKHRLPSGSSPSVVQVYNLDFIQCPMFLAHQELECSLVSWPGFRPVPGLNWQGTSAAQEAFNVPWLGLPLVPYHLVPGTVVLWQPNCAQCSHQSRALTRDLQVSYSFLNSFVSLGGLGWCCSQRRSGINSFVNWFDRSILGSLTYWKLLGVLVSLA